MGVLAILIVCIIIQGGIIESRYLPTRSQSDKVAELRELIVQILNSNNDDDASGKQQQQQKLLSRCLNNDASTPTGVGNSGNDLDDNTTSSGKPRISKTLHAIFNRFDHNGNPTYDRF